MNELSKTGIVRIEARLATCEGVLEELRDTTYGNGNEGLKIGVVRMNDRMMVIDQRIEKMAASSERSDRLRWIVLLTVIGAMITTVGNLVVVFIGTS